MPLTVSANKRTPTSTVSRDHQDKVRSRDQRTKGTGDKRTRVDKTNSTNTDAEDYRTTSLRLRRDVIERAKVLALRHHMPMARIVETALDEYLAAHGLRRGRRSPS